MEEITGPHNRLLMPPVPLPLQSPAPPVRGTSSVVWAVEETITTMGHAPIPVPTFIKFHSKHPAKDLLQLQKDQSTRVQRKFVTVQLDQLHR